MKCICPACGRATQVPPDLLDFLVRCERCGTLLRAKITNFGAADREDHLVAQTVPLGRWREDPFSIRPTVLDVLTPPARGNAHPRLFRAAAARAAAVLHPLASMMPEPIAAEAVAIEQPRGTSPGAPRIKPSDVPHGDIPNAAATDAVPDANTHQAQVFARQRAIRRVQLRSSHQALGIIGLCGIGCVTLLSSVVVALKVATVFTMPRTSSAAMLAPAIPEQPPAQSNATAPEPAARGSTAEGGASGSASPDTSVGELFPEIQAK